MLTNENDYKLLKLIQDNNYISKEELVKKYPAQEKSDLEREADVQFRVNTIFIPNNWVSECRRPSENRPYSGVPTGMYLITPAGIHVIEDYECARKKEKESKDRSNRSIKISVAALIISIIGQSDKILSGLKYAYSCIMGQ